MAGGWNKGQSSALAKLSVQEIWMIKRAYKGGRSISFIARTVGVHRKTIQNIIHNRSYLWVPEEGEDNDPRI
jgi:ActR/RegA family two-component response regulator